MRKKRFARTKQHLDDDPLKRQDVLRKKYLEDEEDDAGGEGRVGGASGEGRRRPRGISYLDDDTPEREDKRRKIEIAGLIAATGLASETRRDRDVKREYHGPGEQLEGVPQHPILGDKQQFDGLDPDVNPLPDLTTPEGQEAYQLQQQLQMQKRLELQQRLQPSIKPSGP